MRYDPWGSTRRQYTGQMNDGNTGLYYYNARYYEPGLARFVQADTIVPEPANPQSFNRYSYTFNNPVKYTDPSGHDPVTDEWRAQFEAAHGRAPEWYDYQILLFSLAYQNEWHSGNLWGEFYNADGSWKGLETMNHLFDNAPASRSWDTLGDALTSLSAFYKEGEENIFVHDIAFLWFMHK